MEDKDEDFMHLALEQAKKALYLQKALTTKCTNTMLLNMQS